MTTESTVDQTVFSTKTDTQTAPAAATPANDFIGEGKKYANADVALASIAPSQAHIVNLEAELAKSRANYDTLQADLNKRETAEEIISRINPAQPEVALPAPTVDLESIKEAARLAATEALNADKYASNMLSNEKLVSDSLKAQYGESVAEVIKAKMDEVGMDLVGMKKMSQESPKAVLAMFSTSKSIEMPAKSTQGTNLANQIHKQTDRVKVMGAATTSELNAEWRRCADLPND